MCARLTLTFLLLAPAMAGNSLVSAVDSIGITVSDLDRSVEFYSKVLSFERVSETEATGPDQEHLQGVFGLRSRTARMRLGHEFIELTEFLAPRGRPMPPDSRANDLWFQHIAIITSNMDRAYQWLRKHKVEHASSGPQRLPDWNKSAGGIQAFYFRDPDGHFLEVLAFPPDKGNPKWHRDDRLFLGIDHTAIVISNTEASLKSYRDLLGFRVAGSENYGTEQEHLNNVFGARLRITAVRTPAGPGIEFLEYLVPRTGRPYPLNEQANDLLHWQTNIGGPSVSSAEQDLRNSSAPFISTGVVNGSLIVRDPDGHAIRISQQ